MAFERIKQCLMNPPVLVPPMAGRPLILYMTVLDELMGCVLRQHDESGKREQVVYDGSLLVGLLWRLDL